MKSSKERKMDRKTKHKALSVAKTESSRQRRLDNKAKHDAIHTICSSINVHIINQVTYNDLGDEIMIEDGKIKTVLKLKTSEDFDQKLQDRIEEVEAVIGKVDSESKFKKIVNKWRL